MAKIQFEEEALQKRARALNRIIDTKLDSVEIFGSLAGGLAASYAIRYLFEQQYTGTHFPWILLGLTIGGIGISKFSKTRLTDARNIASTHNEEIAKIASVRNEETIEAYFIREYDVERLRSTTSN